ncbi:hypothetical protein MPTA5024_03995 [Microbispora sp. ATCC PTA-5024]|nr:hypothetical protein MPTA5024_03995 [Microbispora sp. ATCC PTA-5024]
MTVTRGAAAHPQPEEGVRHGRLAARPVALATSPGGGPHPPLRGPEAGIHRLDGQALLYVPPSAGPGPHRIAVVLHGAGGSAEQALGLLSAQADDLGFLLLAPKSVSTTWDVILGGYGPDVARLDRALEEVFARAAVDLDGVAVAGFSDGASYALSLGVANGDLFRAVLAFSPGFMAPMLRHGRPRLFVSHGADDRVLPVACGRRIAKSLRDGDYPVAYEEFPGGHEVPPDVATAAARWWVQEHTDGSA